MMKAARALSRQWRVCATSKRSIGGFAADSTAPKLSDTLVGVTLVDYAGNRQYVQGRVGQTLCQACEMNAIGLLKDDSGGGGCIYDAKRSDYYTERLFGEGSVAPTAHVIVSNEWISKLPPANDQEQHIISLYVPAEDRSTNSRLGTEIILTPSLHGLVVAVPETPPFETYEYDHDYGDNNDEEDVDNSYAQNQRR